MTTKYLFFWSAGKAEGNKACLSQWYEAPFTVDGITYLTCEHWMMYWKAMLFNDTRIAQKILNEQSPEQVKKFGRSVSNYDDYKWSQVRYEVVVKGNYHKFKQHPELGNWLKTTTEHLVEASPFDDIWGIKMGIGDPNIQDETKWRGLNLLGKALMDVREMLIKEDQT